MVTRTYSFYCVDNGDNMSARVYIIQGRDSVKRWCYPSGCLAVIRQTISRDQAAREMAILRQGTAHIRRRQG